jgi:transcription antitermination factor NusG
MATDRLHLESVNEIAYDEYSVARWYAVHTFAHHEKKVHERLLGKKVDAFLPLYSVKRKRKSGPVQLEMPLFPGYLFVFLPLIERLKVLQVAGVARLVGTNGRPTALLDGEVEALRNARTLGIQTQPHRHLEIGRKVRVTAGPFEGLQGVLTRYKGKYRVVLSLELISSSFVLDIDSDDIEPVKERLSA